VEVTNEGLENVALESTRTIEIDEFVQRDEIDPRYVIRPYYLRPDGKVGHARQKARCLMCPESRKILEATQKRLSLSIVHRSVEPTHFHKSLRGDRLCPSTLSGSRARQCGLWRCRCSRPTPNAIVRSSPRPKIKF
jgi:hypothetical protein